MEAFQRKITCLAGELYGSSDKFWELDKQIKADRRHPGVILNVGKSEVIYDMVRLIRLEVITYDDLADFSEDLQQAVKLILGRERK